MTYLGIDMSTQQCKVLAMDTFGKITTSTTVNYSKDLNEKLIINESTKVVTQNAKTWKKALILAFQKLKNEKNFDFSKVEAISGCGQQHGSVYFKTKCDFNDFHDFDFFDEHTFEKSLCFKGECPIWMDASTTKQCQFLEEKFGKEKLKKVTGSFAFCRFTASQILKRTEKNESEVNETIEKISKISLVSSFVPSLLTNKFCPIDWADASGMNLFDLKNKSWDLDLSKLVNLQDPNKILGHPTNPKTIFGPISKFWVDNFNFKDSCQVVAFTGDNPSALVGVGATEPADCVVSLGTSDTIFVNFSVGENPSKTLQNQNHLIEASGQAHIFCSPLGDPDQYMALCCYRNGSLIREEILKDFGYPINGATWKKVSSILENPNKKWLEDRLFSVFFKLQEITPELGPNFIKRFRNFNFVGDDVNVNVDNGLYNASSKFSFEEEIFSLVTGQLLAKKAHIKKFLKLEKISKLIVTGGASENLGILKLLSNIFQVNVYKLKESSEAAAFGGCVRAKYAMTGQLVEPDYVLVGEPDTSLREFYDEFVERYIEMEERLFES